MFKPICVLTQHNDNNRTGANLGEVQLTTANVNSDQFGKLFARQVDGHMYAQPLYVSDVLIPNKGIHNVVYVATMHNTVYAFDADDPQATDPLWQVSLGKPIPLPDPNIGPRTNLWSSLQTFMNMLVNLVKHPGETIAFLKDTASQGSLPISDIFGSYHDIAKEVGIVSTPVISLAHNALYVVACQKVGNTYAHQLHALDLTTGEHKFGGPVQLCASVPGSGMGSVKGSLPFVSHLQLQRSALLLNNNIVYIAFASYGDQDPYHGWLFAHDATTLQEVGVYNTTPNAGEGGIWMAGQGPASDETNSIYIMSGNGDFQQDGSALGNAIVKLRPDLSVCDWFAPYNTQFLSDLDQDVGSSGVLLIPGTNLLLGGGKEGKLYLLDREHLGNIHAKSDSQIVQSFYVSKYHHIHGGSVYWQGPRGGWIYVWPENDYLKAYQLVNGQFCTTPVSQSTTIAPDGVPGGATGMPGGMLSISADGDTPGSGIVWASHPYRANAVHAVVEGILHAYDASDLTRELWNSEQHPTGRDSVGNFAKFCPPMIANGKVYMASFSGQLAVYGLL